MEWHSWLTVIGAMIAVPLAIGAAWALVRGSFNQARVKELREDNDDLRKRADDKDVEIAAMKLREEALEMQLNQQQTEIEMLTSMLTQRAEVGEVLVFLREHHEQAQQYWNNITVAMTALLDRLEPKA